jgi:hypothetical protein
MPTNLALISRLWTHHGLQNTDQLFQSNLTFWVFALFRFLLCRLTTGAFTIDSLTPTLRINLNEQSICFLKAKHRDQIVSFNLNWNRMVHKVQWNLKITVSVTTWWDGIESSESSLYYVKFNEILILKRQLKRISIRTGRWNCSR